MAYEYQSNCKDCGKEFGYSEASLQGGSVRGLSRPERCPNCRGIHSREGRSIGISQIPVRARMPRKPTEELMPGRLGKLSHPERMHKKTHVESKFSRPDKGGIEFGITDDDIRRLAETTRKYQVSVIVGPTGSGKSTMSEAKVTFIYDVSNLTSKNEPPGAQLYRHMLLKLLRALVFYHPGFVGDITLKIKLAHRRIHYPRAYDLDLANQGYLKVKVDREVWFTAINEKDVKSIMLCLQDSLGFKNIRNTSYEMMPYSEWDTPFMAAADMICNKTFGIAAECKQNMERFYKQLLRNFGRREDRIFFYCPSDYEIPENILTNYYQDKPGEFIADYNSLERRKHKISDFCLLMPALEASIKKLHQIHNPEEYDSILTLADNFLKERLYSKFDVVERLISMVKRRFDEIANKDTADPVWDANTYFYHDISLRYYNHTSNVVMAGKQRKNATKIFNRFMQTDILQVREYHEFLNRTSVTTTNEFAFKKAISYLTPLEKKEDLICELLSDGKTPLAKNEVLGKVCGSMAQNYSFCGEYDKADEYFNKAKYHLGEKNSMQASYRAHLAVDREDKVSYESEICLLFKQETFPGVSVLLNQCTGNVDQDIIVFNLHLLLKGILTFYPGEGMLISEFIEKNEINQRFETFKSHPWALVFIVIGRLLQKQGKINDARTFWHAAAQFPREKEEVTFVMFGHCARAWNALSWLEEQNIQKAKEIIDQIRAYFIQMKQNTWNLGIFNPDNKQEYDGKVWPGWFDDVGKKLLERTDVADRAELQSILEEFVSRFTFNYW
ncbi:MAG: zinc ribbon domain-containing protein [wastewater metagenome]|nr:zinc ribbon domain-containing protein [Candidatus Loosdrechtia aerotolerans]